MRRLWPLFIFMVIFVAALIGFKSKPITENHHTASPQRIISLAPNITEILFALDLGEKVVAVSNYCDFPAEVTQLPKVGDFVNPNIEAIIGHQPDLVILMNNQQRAVTQLNQLGITTLTVASATLPDIQHAIESIGNRTGQQLAATKLIKTLESTIENISQKVRQSSRPKVMISFGNSINSEQIKTVFIAGQHDFYNDLIALAGGTNVYQDSRLNVPSLSIEGIIQLNPDIIIDIFPEKNDHSSDLEQVQQRWQSLHYVNAVKNNRIYIIEESYATIPGPRIILLLEQLARLIHPELEWDKLTP